MPPAQTRKVTSKLSELRARVAELERERELLNAIANWAPSLLCLVGSDGRVRPYASNKAFERTMGYEPEETGGVLFWDRYVPPEDAARVQVAIEAVIAGGPVEEREGRWLTRTGEIIHVIWSCTPLPMIESGPVFLILATDITELKRGEEEMRRSRARIVAAGDEARRRLERNLHDGAQQRLMFPSALSPGCPLEGGVRAGVREGLRRRDRRARRRVRGVARARPRNPP